MIRLFLKQVPPPGLSRWTQAFALASFPSSGAARVVQKPLNHRGKPGGGQRFAWLRSNHNPKRERGILSEILPETPKTQSPAHASGWDSQSAMYPGRDVMVVFNRASIRM